MSAKIGILGGTFNPVHFGHLRLGIEALEQCGLDRIEFVPTSIPPHKQGTDLYPFPFRCRLLQEAIAGSRGLVVNPLEGERSGPSYTVDTLKEYHKRQPGTQFFFVMGSEDFLQLEQWERWEELPLLTSFILVGRNGKEEAQLKRFLLEQWPDVKQVRENPGQWVLQSKTEFYYLHVPRFDLSGSLIRQKLGKGLSLRFLVPDRVEQLLCAYQAGELYDL